MDQFVYVNNCGRKVSRLVGKLTGKGLYPTAVALAVSISTNATAQEGAAIAVGETDLIPAVRIDYVSTDNLYRKAEDEVSGSGVLVAPSLVWRADRRLLSLSAQYAGEYGSYSEDGLDYDDHELLLQGNGNISSKQRLFANLSFSKTTEEQGTGQTSTVLDPLDEQIEINQVTGRVAYTYGSLEARGNITGGLLVNSTSFANVEQFTDGDDYSLIQPYGVFSLRISPDTRALFEVRIGQRDYDADINDRSELSLLTGVELSASSKLSGNARVGFTSVSYDNADDADSTAVIAEVGLLYSPVSYSTIGLNLDRRLATEEIGNGLLGDSVYSSAEVAWNHDWSSRIQSTAAVSYLDSDRDCPDYSTQTLSATLELNYQVRRWLSFGVSGGQATRALDACEGTTEADADLDYDRSVVGAHVRATL